MRVRSPERREVSSKPESAPRRFGAREAVIVCAVVYAIAFSALSIHKHEIYSSSRFDLGNMDQAVWNSAHGRILEATDEQGELTSRLKNHADFLLLAFVPLYWIHPSPYWLLVAQAAVVGLGALPLYWISRRFLEKEWPAALIAVAYLFHPGLQSANLFDFHAQMMAGTFLLFAFHYLLEKRLLPFVFSSFLAATTKEGIVLIVGIMGLYAILAERRWRWGIPVFLASAGYFLLTMLAVIPYFNTGGSSGLVEERYEAFGGSMSGLVTTALTDPVFVLAYALSNGKALYLLYLVGMTGLLGLFAPLLLAIPLPELGINLLSDRPQMTDMYYHYSAPIIPFTYAAAAAGIANLTRFFKSSSVRRRLGRLAPGGATLGKLPVALSAGILLFGVQMDLDQGPLPVFHSPGNHRSVIDPASDRHIEALDDAVALIPDDARVSATNNIGPHLAHRRYLYLFPTVRDAEYVVLDETEPAYDTQISPVLNLQSTRGLGESPDFRRVFDRDGVLVFERARPIPDKGE